MSVVTPPVPDLLALVTGESILAFVPRAGADTGDEVDLAPGGTRATSELKPAYRGWATREAPPGPWTATVEEVVPAAALDAEAATSRHVLAAVPAGDVLVLRVHGPAGPVLSDVAFTARRRSVDAALGR